MYIYIIYTYYYIYIYNYLFIFLKDNLKSFLEEFELKHSKTICSCRSLIQHRFLRLLDPLLATILCWMHRWISTSKWRSPRNNIQFGLQKWWLIKVFKVTVRWTWGEPHFQTKPNARNSLICNSAIKFNNKKRRFEFVASKDPCHPRNCQTQICSLNSVKKLNIAAVVRTWRLGANMSKPKVAMLTVLTWTGNNSLKKLSSHVYFVYIIYIHKYIYIYIY